LIPALSEAPMAFQNPFPEFWNSLGRCGKSCRHLHQVFRLWPANWLPDCAMEQAQQARPRSLIEHNFRLHSRLSTRESPLSRSPPSSTFITRYIIYGNPFASATLRTQSLPPGLRSNLLTSRRQTCDNSRVVDGLTFSYCSTGVSFFRKKQSSTSCAPERHTRIGGFTIASRIERRLV